MHIRPEAFGRPDARIADDEIRYLKPRSRICGTAPPRASECADQVDKGPISICVVHGYRKQQALIPVRVIALGDPYSITAADNEFELKTDWLPRMLAVVPHHGIPGWVLRRNVATETQIPLIRSKRVLLRNEPIAVISGATVRDDVLWAAPEIVGDKCRAPHIYETDIETRRP